jgi:ABC-type multidrug transport system ATPase subunit
LTGKILFNGRTERSRGRRQLMSYVAQEDALMGSFTVSETLWFAARFYYGYNVDKEKLSRKIEDLIDSVGLRSSANTIVGNIFFKGLSGGTRVCKPRQQLTYIYRTIETS